MNGTYYTITEVFDFGPHISKVILDYGKSMKGAVPSPEQFTVHVTRTSTEGEDFVWPNFMGDKPDDSMDGTRRVSNVYVSDKTGAPCEDGTCLTLELPHHHGTISDKGTEECQADVYEKQIATLRNIDYIKGMTPWILYDFRCPRRTSLIQKYYNRKGLLSEDKKYRKPAFYVLQKFYEELKRKEQ